MDVRYYHLAYPNGQTRVAAVDPTRELDFLADVRKNGVSYQPAVAYDLTPPDDPITGRPAGRPRRAFTTPTRYGEFEADSARRGWTAKPVASAPPVQVPETGFSPEDALRRKQILGTAQQQSPLLAKLAPIKASKVPDDILANETDKRIARNTLMASTYATRVMQTPSPIPSVSKDDLNRIARENESRLIQQVPLGRMAAAAGEAAIPGLRVERPPSQGVGQGAQELAGTVLGLSGPTLGAGLVAGGANVATRALPTLMRAKPLTALGRVAVGALRGLARGAAGGAAYAGAQALMGETPPEEKAAEAKRTVAGFAAFGTVAGALSEALPAAFFQRNKITPEEFKSKYPDMAKRVDVGKGTDAENAIVREVNSFLGSVGQKPGEYARGRAGLDVTTETARPWTQVSPLTRSFVPSVKSVGVSGATPPEVPNAVPKQSASEVDVRQPPGNGEAVGARNAVAEVPARAEGQAGEPAAAGRQVQGQVTEPLSVPAQAEKPAVNQGAAVRPTEPALATGQPAEGVQPPITKAAPTSSEQPTGPGTPSATSPEFVGGTALKNAVGEIERMSAGLPPAEPTETVKQAEDWVRAERVIASDPTVGSRLVEEIKSNPMRVLNREESGVMLRYKVALENEYNAAAEATNTAKTPQEVEAAKARFDTAKREFNDLLDAVKTTGTESGRAFRWRQVMANEDFSLATMMRRAQAENGGKPLTSQQEQRVIGQQKEIVGLQQKIQERESKQGELALESSVAKISAEKPKANTDWEARRQKAVDRLIEKSADAKPEFESVGRDIQEIARYFVGQGIRERNALVAAVHEVVSPIMPDWTPRMTRDAISGYGQFKPLSKDEISVALRDLKGQMQQVSKLDDMIQKHQLPLRTGFEQREMSAEERKLTKEVEATKRRLNLQPVDRAKQLKSALDSAKTRLRHSVEDMLKRFETGEKTPKKEGVPLDAEAERIRAVRDNLKKTIESLEGKTELSDEQRIAMATSSLEKAITEYERKIAEGDLTVMRGASKTPVTPELAALRSKRDALKASLQAMKDAAFPEPPEDVVRLRQLKARMESRIRDYEDRRRRGDFEKKQKPPVVMDKEASDLWYKEERVKKEYYEDLIRYRHANETPAQKGARWLKNVAQFGRVIKSSFDHSSIGKQGGFLNFGHPVMMVKNALTSLGSARARTHFDIVREMENSPNAPRWRRAGLYLAHQARTTAQAEEAYQSAWAEKVPGIAQSQWMYNDNLDLQRTKVFDMLVRKYEKRYGPMPLEEERALARSINDLSGRGEFPGAAGAGEFLNIFYYAPRWVASRFKTLLGAPIIGGQKRGSWKVRELFVEEYTRTAIGLGALYSLAVLAGAKVDKDPNSTYFGTIQFGDSPRIDPTFGIRQSVTLLSRLITGRKTTNAGKNVKIRDRWVIGEGAPKNYGGDEADDLLYDFSTKKFSPNMGFIMNMARGGEDMWGNKMTPQSAASDLFMPITFGEIAQNMKAQGIEEGSGYSVLSFIGVQAMNDMNRQQKPTPSEAWWK